MSTLATRIPLGRAEQRDARLGLALGALGVLVFALSIPMTRLASGSEAAPQLPAAFVAIGRAALAGLLAAAYLAVVRAPRPQRADWLPLASTAAGVVFGWPLFLGFAVRHVDASHAAVVTGILPLATAAIGALVLRQRPAPSFWLWAVVGCLLVLAFAAWRGGHGLQWADGLLLLAVLSAAWGYVSGARLSNGRMAPQHVISWVLVLSLPLTVPITLACWPTQPVTAAAWGGFLYVAVFSMWLGFFAWYRGLALGGTLRVSQVQLVQPFASLLLAWPVLGEPVDAATVCFSLAVMATVFAGKRAPVNSLDRP